MVQAEWYTGPALGPAGKALFTIPAGGLGGDTLTLTVVDGGVRADSAIVPGAVGVDSTVRDVDEMEFADFTINVGTIRPGVSFDLIIMNDDDGAEGDYYVHFTRA